MSALYEKDFYAWCINQAENLEKGNIDKLDLKNLGEELESLGNSQKTELRSHLSILFLHLLKWYYQPNYEYKGSWARSIGNARVFIEVLIDSNPSLKHYEKEIALKAYQYARKDAAIETGLREETFPKELPFLYEDCIKTAWLPNGDEWKY